MAYRSVFTQPSGTSKQSIPSETWAKALRFGGQSYEDVRTRTSEDICRGGGRDEYNSEKIAATCHPDEQEIPVHEEGRQMMKKAGHMYESEKEKSITHGQDQENNLSFLTHSECESHQEEEEDWVEHMMRSN